VPPNKSIYLSISGANSEFFDGENRVGKMKNVHLWMEKFHFANSKRKTFFYWNLKRKISNFKIQRGPRSPLPMSMISSSCSTQISNSFPLVFQLSNTLIFRNRAWNRNFMIAVRKKRAAFPIKSGVFSNFPWCKFCHDLHGADFCRKMIYSTPGVDLLCALCTSWSVAKYCRLCW